MLMLRDPSHDAARSEWWEAAISGNRMPTHEDEPHAGLFKWRRNQWTPWLPVRVFWEGPVCPTTGELLGDEKLVCEINGARVDLDERWVWVAKWPITQAEFDDLTTMAGDFT